MMSILTNIRGWAEWHRERRRVRKEPVAKPAVRQQTDPPRYRLHPSGEVFDTIGRWWYPSDMWAQKLAENRSPNAHHDFQRVSGLVPEEGIPAQWGRIRVVCRHCGEERLVYHGVDLRVTNHSWCIDRDGTWDPASDVVALRAEEV